VFGRLQQAISAAFDESIGGGHIEK